MVDVSSFRSLGYTIFCLTNLLLYVCIDVPYMYLPSQATTSGSSEKDAASLLVATIGIFNSVGVVSVQWPGCFDRELTPLRLFTSRSWSATSATSHGSMPASSTAC